MVLSGAKEIQDAGGTIWAGKEDADEIKKQCGVSEITEMRDGDVISCGDLVLHAISTPGHTPGSICVFAAPRCLSPRESIGKTCLQEQLTKADSGLLITGDTLFVGSCGRTDLPGSDQRDMFSSLARLSTLGPEVIVCPGHNYGPKPFTTVGAEKAQNQMVKMGLQQCPMPLRLPPCCASSLVCPPCGPKGFRIGRKVVISGLASESGKAMNGQEAVVEAFVEERERYAVRLFGASGVKVLKSDNLEDVTKQAASASASAGYPVLEVDVD